MTDTVQISVPLEKMENTLAVLSKKMPAMRVDLVFLGSLTRLLHTQISSQINACLSEHGLSESLWYAVLAIYAHPNHEILPSELSEVLQLTRTSATRLSDELVAKGWITRYTHPQDRRKITLRLTEAGEALIQRVSPKTNQVRSQFWSRLDATEKTQLKALLKKALGA